MIKIKYINNCLPVILDKNNIQLEKLTHLSDQDMVTAINSSEPFGIMFGV